VRHLVKVLVTLRRDWKSGTVITLLIGMARSIRRAGQSVTLTTMSLDSTDHATHCTASRWLSAVRISNLDGHSAKRSTGLHHSMVLDG